jgi:hypothetical protein
MPLNKRRKYSNFKQFNDACYTAVHEAKDVYVESLGATVRTGGELDFVKEDKCQKRNKTDRYLRNKNVDVAYVDRLLQGVCKIRSPGPQENG